MSNYRFIGIGAAGNKAVIELIESGIAAKEDVLLLNTTMRDIDPRYKCLAKQIGDSMSGSGKERKLAFKLASDELAAGHLNYLEEFLSAQDIYCCNIVASIGGGTGSGASIAIANHIAEMGIPVHLCGYIGFSTDSRELQNTIGFAKDIENDFGVEFICNNKFLEAANDNIQKAEQLANKELSVRMQIYTGQLLRDSSQNIDDTELYKINSTPGFSTVEYSKLPKIKNQDQFNTIINNMVDNTKSPDFDPLAKRIAVVLNISKESFANIDTRFQVIKQRFGINPVEFFTHIQHEPDIEEFVAVIAGGNEIPIEDIKSMAEELNKQDSFNKETDRGLFFKELNNISPADDTLNDMDLNMNKRRKRIRTNTLSEM